MRTAASIALLVLSTLWVGEASAQRSQFTRDERSRLDRGALVVRASTRAAGELRLVGGTSFQVIDLPPDVVFRAVLDTPRYTHFVPRLSSARMDHENGNRRRIFLRHQQGPVDASYHLDVEVDEEARHAAFSLDKSRPHAIREAWGFFNVTPYRGGRSLVTFGVMADVGSGMVTGVMRPAIHEWMLRVPELLRRWVEGSGRQRYETSPRE